MVIHVACLTKTSEDIRLEDWELSLEKKFNKDDLLDLGMAINPIKYSGLL